VAGWIWLVVAVLLGVAEASTGGLVFACLAVAALVASLPAFLGRTLLVQFGTFLISMVLAWLTGSRLVTRTRRRTRRRGLEVAAPLSRDGVVTHDIDPVHGTGLVKVGDEVWRAVADAPVPAGAAVRVTAVRGAKLVVELRSAEP
jgi:membrane protein implicated in regulation of membrane protease activity